MEEKTQEVLTKAVGETFVWQGVTLRVVEDREMDCRGGDCAFDIEFQRRRIAMGKPVWLELQACAVDDTCLACAAKERTDGKLVCFEVVE
jgi:hypothetical protein